MSITPNISNKGLGVDHLNHDQNCNKLKVLELPNPPSSSLLTIINKLISSKSQKSESGGVIVQDTSSSAASSLALSLSPSQSHSSTSSVSYTGAGCSNMICSIDSQSKLAEGVDEREGGYRINKKKNNCNYQQQRNEVLDSSSSPHHPHTHTHTHPHHPLPPPPTLLSTSSTPSTPSSPNLSSPNPLPAPFLLVNSPPLNTPSLNSLNSDPPVDPCNQSKIVPLQLRQSHGLNKNRTNPATACNNNSNNNNKQKESSFKQTVASIITTATAIEKNINIEDSDSEGESQEKSLKKTHSSSATYSLGKSNNLSRRKPSRDLNISVHSFNTFVSDNNNNINKSFISTMSTMSDLPVIHKTTSNASKSSTKVNGPKKLMMGIGNKFTSRKVSNSIPKEEQEAIIHEEYINSAPPLPSLDIPGIGNNRHSELFDESTMLGFDFDNNYEEPSSPNSIQPSPIMNNDGFDKPTLKKSMTAPVSYKLYDDKRVSSVLASTPASTSTSTSSTSNSSSNSNTSVTTNGISDDDKKENDYTLPQHPQPIKTSINRYSTTNLSGLGVSDIQLESKFIPRIKKAFNQYTPIDGTSQATSILPDTPTSDTFLQTPSDKSSISPVRGKVRPKSSMTFSKKLIFSNIDEVANRDMNVDEVKPPAAALRSPIIELNDQTSPSTTYKHPASYPILSENTAANSDSDSDFENETLLPFATSPSQHDYISPHHSKSFIPNGKVMTKSQFDNYRKSIVGLSDLTDNDNNSRRGNDNEYDDLDDNSHLLKHLDDDSENKKESLRMRLKQDAHLSVYRQKMTKITTSTSSGALSSFQSPGPSRFNSSNNLASMGLPSNGYIGELDLDEDMDDDEYDDVPLGILKAHGFPSGPQKPINTLKHTQSQPSLNELPVPSVLYQNRQSDAMSLNSGYSNILPSSHSAMAPQTPVIMPPEGELLVKPAMTNDIFGNPTTQMNRGLIGEIAREEEAKLKRRSYGNLLSAQRAQTLMGTQSGYAGSLYNGFTQSNSPPPNQPPSSSSNEIQQQLQQMMQMQMQMLQQIQGNGAPQLTAQRKQPMSSFDLVRQSASMPFSPRPGSIRSVAMSDRSLEVGKSPYLRNTLPSQGRFSPALQFGVRPQSTMNIVSNNNNNNDEEDDDDDDEGWNEMLEKRRQLKEMWKRQSHSLPLVS